MGRAILSDGSGTLKDFCYKLRCIRDNFEDELSKIIKLFESYNPVWQDAVYNHIADALEIHRLSMEKNIETLDGLIYALDRMAEFVSGYLTD